MRYSKMVYLAKMSRTLLEAAQYLREQPGSGQRDELLENGRIMLGQIKDTLEQHKNDLRSSLLVELIDTVSELWESFDQELETVLARFPKCLPQEIQYQVRAVFFAELGEKWDSMESVYAYMRDNPLFDPVVVLTPVFREVMQNGRPKREVIYRDYLSALGIPFLGYRDYRIENDCPDLAFTSQPYDSVAFPQFQSQYVTQFTRLIYLPYGAADRVLPEFSIGHSRLPIHASAWKVVMQSENMLEFYRQTAVTHGANAILTGLPKLDHIALLRAQGAQLPTGWEKIYDKTVFFWNSWYDISVSSMRYFDAIIEWFRLHPECALIWRQHPMTDTVTKLYYSQQYPLLQAHMREVDGMENVVLDKETSYDAAFFFSDAMLSDFSSLLPQYLLMDKPTLHIHGLRDQTVLMQLIEDSWQEQAENAEQIYSFFERISKGEDRGAPLRKEILGRDLPLADGHSGERVCKAAWTAMLLEDIGAVGSKED